MGFTHFVKNICWIPLVFGLFKNQMSFYQWFLPTLEMQSIKNQCFLLVFFWKMEKTNGFWWFSGPKNSKNITNLKAHTVSTKIWVTRPGPAETKKKRKRTEPSRNQTKQNWIRTEPKPIRTEAEPNRSRAEPKPSPFGPGRLRFGSASVRFGPGPARPRPGPARLRPGPASVRFCSASVAPQTIPLTHH